MKPSKDAREEARRRPSLRARVVAELDTIGFWVAYCLFVAGVALLSVPIALILGGLVLGAICALAAIAKGKKAEGRAE